MSTNSASGRSLPRRQASHSDDPFLIAKITPPAVPGWVVSRERIEKRIAAGAAGPLTVITGPPGAGKTVAMASWVAASAGQDPIAWLTLDEYDNRPRVFWSYVVEALRHSGVSVTRSVSAAARGGGADLGFILRLASAIAAQGTPVSLVLDDLHLVTSHALMDGLTRLLRNAHPALHIVVASRGDPGLPLHRYRLAGELTEIRASDLAFTVGEASLLMAQHGVALPSHSLEFLNDRAEGWAAALRLAAISMNGSPDPEQSVKEIAAEDGAVAGYLVEEVLSTQSARVRNLLLKTSILDRVRADIASELAGDEQATIELPALAEANTLVEPLRHGWYRYHSLFAEVLRLKLGREIPGEVPELHRRAAEWLRRNGTLAEAARQAAEGGDWQLAARIVIDELAVTQLIEPAAIEPLAEVLRGMPQSQAWTRPQAWLVIAALGLPSAAEDAIGPPLAAAGGMLQKLPPDEEIPSRLAAALIGLVLARRTGDLPAATAAVADAELLLGKLPPRLLERRPEVRAQVMAGRGVVQFWSGDFNQAAATFHATMAETHNAHLRAECLGHLALADAVTGRLTRAAELAMQAADSPGDGKMSGDHAGCAAKVALAYVHLQRHELHDARRDLKQADAALRACPDKLIGAVAGLVAARGCLAEGRAHEACGIVARVRHGWSPAPWLQRHLALVESQAHAAAGDAEAARAAARRAGAGTFLDATAALASAALVTGDVRAASEALAAAPAHEHQPDLSRLEARLTEARLAHLAGERDHALRALADTLRLARAEQVRLPFAMERPWLRVVLEHDPNLAHAYRQLLEPRRLTRGQARPPMPGERKTPATVPGTAVTVKDAPMVVEKLSEREREVLRHVSQLLGTAEIAAEMYVSVNTVKSHLKSIFRKLGAASRNEAVRTARTLELI